MSGFWHWTIFLANPKKMRNWPDNWSAKETDQNHMDVPTVWILLLQKIFQISILNYYIQVTLSATLHTGCSKNMCDKGSKISQCIFMFVRSLNEWTPFEFSRHFQHLLFNKLDVNMKFWNGILLVHFFGDLMNIKKTFDIFVLPLIKLVQKVSND